MSLASFGELLIDFVSTESGVSVGDAPGFVKKPGGAPANVAVAVRRLGMEAAFLTQVGNDPFGHYLAGVLDAEGVDISGLRYSDQANTALAFVSLGEGGERTFSFYRKPSADMLMTPDDVATDVIDRMKVFHYGSITMISEPSASATVAALKHAQSAGKFISYDPNLRLPLWESPQAAREGIMHGFPYADIIKVSDDELEFLTGGDDAYALWQDKTKALVVTHGAQGATLYLKDAHLRVGTPIVTSVDTTGAGDAFTAGIIYGVVNHMDDENLFKSLDGWKDILRFANTMGALATTQKGAIPALPTRAQVEAKLATW